MASNLDKLRRDPKPNRISKIFKVVILDAAKKLLILARIQLIDVLHKHDYNRFNLE